MSHSHADIEKCCLAFDRAPWRGVRGNQEVMNPALLDWLSVFLGGQTDFWIVAELGQCFQRHVPLLLL